jgi:serine-type D-Ala-D-Ala carboxypeptidase
MPTKANQLRSVPDRRPAGLERRIASWKRRSRREPSLGVHLACWPGGEVVLPATHIGALGRFTFEPESPLVSAETAYDVASLTKVVATTAAMMLLVQRQQIDVDTLLGDLLPGFVVGRAPGDAARKVTLRHLLAHNSGLPGYVELFRAATTPEALFRACLELPLEVEPGTRAEYSDPGFILLGKALEVRTGETLDSWLRREVLRAARHGVPRASAPPRHFATRFHRRKRTHGSVIA